MRLKNMFKIKTKLTRESLKNFLEKYRSDKLTLDLGCKNAPYGDLFANRIGFDVECGKGVDVVGDAHKLPFKDDEFELILCTEVLEHLHSPAVAVKEMKRVLKNGGLLILTTRFVFPLHDAPNDYYRFTKYGLKHLFGDWDILELKEDTDTMTTIAVLFERLLLQTTGKNRLIKIIWLFLRWLMPKMNFLIRQQYGDINRKKAEINIMTSGYYIVCKNKKQ